MLLAAQALQHRYLINNANVLLHRRRPSRHHLLHHPLRHFAAPLDARDEVVVAIEGCRSGELVATEEGGRIAPAGAQGQRLVAAVAF